MNYLIKLFCWIGGIVLIACPIIFGYCHNYSAMWCSLILAIVGFFMVIAFIKTDKIPVNLSNCDVTIKDSNVTVDESSKIELNAPDPEPEIRSI